MRKLKKNCVIFGKGRLTLDKFRSWSHNCEGDWLWYKNRIFFQDEADKIKFILRFL